MQISERIKRKRKGYIMKKKIGFGIAGGIIFLFIIGFLYYHFGVTVLDKITFLSRIPVLEPFYEIEELDVVDYGVYSFEGFGIGSQDEYFMGLILRYKEEYLKDEVKIRLFFPKDKQYTQIYGSVDLKKHTHIIIDMAYNPMNRSLILEPIYISNWENGMYKYYEDKESITQYLEEYNITEEDIRDYQDYILYEVILKTWVETQGGNYEREREKLERCIIDQTFDLSRIT